MSYDALAPDYDQNWLSHLQPTTLKLMEQLPQHTEGRILDLGCGTGFTTEWLAKQYPHAVVLAQDISEGMLEEARNRVQANTVSFACGDMLDFMNSQSSKSATLAVSAWAIGYSNPRKILKEAYRILEPGGRFAFVVNLMDTLRPVYVAFRKTMQRYPEKLHALSNPRFPVSWKQLEKKANGCGFETEWSDEGMFEICEADQISLPWLLGTGILAGFDAMLPLKQDAEAAAYFEHNLKSQNEPLVHNHIMAILRKHE